MPIIKLQSSDGEIFEVDVEIAKASVTIKTMLEDLGMDDDEEEVVPLPNVNAAILKKVIQWATYHKDDPPAPEDDENKEKRTDDISSWDADFLKVDQGTLFELILAANYLDIKGLLDVTCKTVANMIKGKTPGGNPQDFQHQERLHPVGGRAGEEGKRVVRGKVDTFAVAFSPLFLLRYHLN